MYNFFCDSVLATVIGGNSRGVRLKLPSGEIAFCNFGYIENGTVVICKIRKLAKEFKPAIVDIETTNVL